MKAELVPMNGDPPIPITRDVTVVGRREFCDVRIDFHGLSKRHCILVKTDGLLVIRDLATTNGTKVNGQRIKWAALLPNDRVAMGGYKMRVYLGPDDVPSPSESKGRNIQVAPKAKPPAVVPPPKPQPIVPVAPKSPPALLPADTFPSPSPLSAPLVTQKDVDHAEWVSPDDLIDDDLPASSKPSKAPVYEDEEFVIDLD
jgi:pSer/pThr/pTyr-binding forkhead associated (FHA) protein